MKEFLLSLKKNLLVNIILFSSPIITAGGIYVLNVKLNEIQAKIVERANVNTSNQIGEFKTFVKLQNDSLKQYMQKELLAYNEKNKLEHKLISEELIKLQKSTIEKEYLKRMFELINYQKKSEARYYCLNYNQ